MHDDQQEHRRARHFVRQVAEPPIGQGEEQQPRRDEVEDKTEAEKRRHGDLLYSTGVPLKLGMRSPVNRYSAEA